MTVNFYELLQKGKSAADQVIKNNNEIYSTLDELKDSLSKFLDMDVDLIENIEFERENANVLMSNLLATRKKTGFNIVSIAHDATKINKELFSIKRSNEGYPVTLSFDEAHYVADNKSEFDKALGIIVASSKTNLTLRAFKRMVMTEQEKSASTKRG